MRKISHLLYALLICALASFASACTDDTDDLDPECEDNDPACDPTPPEDHCEDDDPTCAEQPEDDHPLWGDASGECGNGIVEGWEECDEGEDMPTSDCYACRIQVPQDGEPLALASTNTWEYYEVDGAICRDGSQAGFSISPGTDTSKLVFFFEGGGACFEALNCSANPASIGGKFPGGGGIFDRTRAENPFQDWTYVYLPYCSGDVFAGNATDANIKNGPQNQQFVGDSNMKLFLERIIPTFQNVEHVVSTGISAGGLASIVNAKRLARAFPDAPRVTVLDDGGPPLSTTVVSECMQQHWNDLYNLKETVLPDCGWNCAKSNDLLLPMTQDLVTSNQRIDVGLFSFLHDSTVRLLFTFGMNKCQWLPVPFMSPQTLEDGLQEFRTVMRETGETSEDQTALRTATFYAPGMAHVCINHECFYSTTVDGVRLTDWTRDLLDQTFSDVGFTD